MRTDRGPKKVEEVSPEFLRVDPGAGEEKRIQPYRVSEIADTL